MKLICVLSLTALCEAYAQLLKETNNLTGSKHSTQT